MSDSLDRCDADRSDMSTMRPPHPQPGRHRGGRPAAHPGLSDAAVERLLRGDPAGDPTAARLARVLAAAAAPATLDELRHADAICSAYSAHARKHRKAAAVGSGRTSARLLSVKLAIAAAAAATVAGGVAFAASAGILPTPLFPGPAASRGDEPAKPGPSGPARSATPTSPPSAVTVADTAPLCAAYQATTLSEREAMLATPAFTLLVAAAGGAAKVPAYCATAAERTPAPAVTPTRRPTGKPTVLPSHPSTSREPTRSPARQAR
jgi:hypothetical protein